MSDVWVCGHGCWDLGRLGGSLIWFRLPPFTELHLYKDVGQAQQGGQLYAIMSGARVDVTDGTQRLVWDPIAAERIITSSEHCPEMAISPITADERDMFLLAANDGGIDVSDVLFVSQDALLSKLIVDRHLAGKRIHWMACGVRDLA